VAAVLAAGALMCTWAEPAAAQQRVTVVMLPSDTSLGEVASIPGIAVGVMSTGIGEGPPEQAFLDISQGNRVDGALYDRPLPPLTDLWRRVPHWAQIVERAAAAPADLVPGLLASSLLAGGIRSEALPAAKTAALIAVRRDGARGIENPGALSVVASGVGLVRKQAPFLRPGNLLIAFAEPDGRQRAVPIGIAGTGFDGNLTSDSTRTDGYVLSSDIAPTILRRFGLPIPDEMNGEPIHTEGAIDPGAVEELADRMDVIPDRRGPVLIACLAGWIGLALALAGLGRARVGAAWLALAFAYLPLVLLAAAAIEPGAEAEGALVGFGAAGLAAITLGLFSGWRAPAIACALTVIAYAVDVTAGSGLTRVSLLGPNPIYGVRFYGIGNELEALFAVMVPVGVGAGLSAYTDWGGRLSRRLAVLAFLAVGAVTTIVFAAGRFGADVGAAIVLPVGAAVAVACLPTDSVHLTRNTGVNRTKPFWRALVAAVAAPFVALLFLALIDLVSGANAHLTRSVLDAGGAGDLGDVAQRRLELSGEDFSQAAGNPLFWLLIAVIAAAVSQWRRIDAWLRQAPFVRAGVLGACVALAVGMLVNDSGATFLVLGACSLGASVAYAWSQA
jgi:hypothetical protein